MCTVSWIHDKDGYQLFCNRDEKLTRKTALEPRVAVLDGTQFLAPVDGDFGGAWIATNEFGVSACLLNGASLTGSNSHSETAGRSRGFLLLEIIPLPSVAAICNLLKETELSAFAPFTLAALEPTHPVAIVEWDGSKKTLLFEPADRFMLTSSSFDSEKVRRSRYEEYNRVEYSHVHDREGLFAFHRSHAPARSAHSPCMHRADAKTVSFSWIQVARKETDFFYTPGAPCEKLPGVRLKLARCPSSGSNQQHRLRVGQAQKAL
jgi:transport and Golgi organization protein 2